MPTRFFPCLSVEAWNLCSKEDVLAAMRLPLKPHSTPVSSDAEESATRAASTRHMLSGITLQIHPYLAVLLALAVQCMERKTIPRQNIGTPGRNEPVRQENGRT